MGIIKKFFYLERPIAGLDISSHGLKVMLLDQNKWTVAGYGSLDLDSASVQLALSSENDYLTKSIKLLLSKKIIGQINTTSVALSLPASQTFSRTFSLPKKTKHYLKEAVKLEIEQYIPIPIDKLYIDYEVIKETKTELMVLLSAIPRKITDRAITSANQAGLDVALVEPSTNSLTRLLSQVEDGDIPTIIVDIGPDHTDIAITDESIVRVTNSLSVGGDNFTVEISRELNLSLESAHQLKILNGLDAGPKQAHIKSALEPSLQAIIREIRKVIRYFNERISQGRKLEQLLIVGSGSSLPGIGEYFTDELVIPARVACPWQKINFQNLPEPDPQYRSRYLTVAGLALASKKELKND